MRRDDLSLFFDRGIVDGLLEQETVELRFGKRIDPLLLDRVLGRDDHEAVAELMALPIDRNLALLHRLQKRRLSFGRRSVDLIGKQELGNNRTAGEREARRL